ACNPVLVPLVRLVTPSRLAPALSPQRPLSFLTGPLFPARAGSSTLGLDGSAMEDEMGRTKAGSQGLPALSRRDVVLAGLAAALPTVHAQGGGKRQATPERNWRLLVNEAFTGESNLFVLTARYRPLADYVTSQMRERPPFAIEPVVNVHRFLELAQAEAKPELVFGKSVNQLAKLVRDTGYQPVVHRADPYKAAFIVASDSPIKSLADASRLKAKVIMPDEMAATTAVARAELRLQHAGGVQVVHTRY